MKRAKSATKNILAIITLLAVLTTAMTPAFAANLKFKDLSASKYDWVRPYIEKMTLMGFVKGISDTEYAPDASVTRAQVVTMLIRLMGLEGAAAGKQLPASFPKPNSVPSWAKEYVALAVEKGIISGSDLKDFRAEDAAKRYEVAVFAVKALGFSDEAENKKTTKLIFSDIYDIPLDDSWAWAYVEVAAEKGIMQGFPGGVFKPNDKITRAQMAKMLDNLLKLVPTDVLISGSVQDVDTIALPSITVKKSDGTYATYSVSDSASIYKEDQSGNLQKKSINDIKTGEIVNILLDKNNAAIYVESVSDKSTPPSTGSTVNGIIAEIDTDRKLITVKNEDTSKNETYTMSSDASIIRDGKAVGLSELRVNDAAQISISDSKIIKIVAQSIQTEAKGTISDITLTSKNPIITLIDDLGQKTSCEIDEDVVIRRNNRSAGLKDLKMGDYATLSLRSGRAVQITAKSVKRDISGTVKEIVLSDTSLVKIIDKDNKEHSFLITPDTDIYKDRKLISVYDLRIGNYLEVEVEGDEALYIDVTTIEVQNTIQGTVQYIHRDMDVIVISHELEDGTKQTELIRYTRDTVIRKGTKEVSIRSVEAGDEIIAIGKHDAGLFNADTIIDLTISK